MTIAYARKLRRSALCGMMFLVLVVVVSAGSAAAAPSCSRTRIAGAEKLVDPGRIDQRLLDASVLAEVNYLRCRKGLAKLAPANGMRRAAETHARWMARAHDLTHLSSLRGKRTTSQRILAAARNIHMGSENIAKVSLYRLDEAGRYRIVDAPGCHFETGKGTRIGRHSYASLARYVTDLWYRSGGHRKNMMDRRARIAGAGAGYDPRAGNCGGLYISQTIAG
ncbi:CAP domain-containing protein [Tropicimonas sp.]|uniref:CAP domain-containing protein n=1 Tax=Tropicimonas sp. TaxID=2067044 RepID=UPI003A89095F